MSIRIKLILSYFTIILISLLILIFSFVKTTTEFVHRVAESTFENVPIDEAISDILDVIVDFKYMTKYEPDNFSNEEFISDIESLSTRYGIYFYIAVDKEIVYKSANSELIEFDDELFDLKFVKGHRNEPFRMSNYSTLENEFTILRYDENESEDTNAQFYIVYNNNELNTIGEQVYNSVFEIFFIIIILILFLMTLVVTKMIVKPLRRLEEATIKIKNGQLDFKLPRNKKDEIGKVMTSFDIMREELKNSIEKQIQYEENRKELITSISHDLKTPITSIKGYVEGIKDGVANDPIKMDKYLDVIYKKSIILDQLIDDLFLFSKLDLNRMPFNFEKVNAMNYFNDCIDEIAMDLKKIDFQLNYQTTLSSDCYMMIDPQQFKRVILNVVQNAVKYSMNNQEIEIRTDMIEEMIHVEIQDYGKGISQDELDKIFEKFYRCDKSRNTKVSGSGLGLAIAKQIIEQLNGLIWAESERDIGTTIFIEIPRIKE